MNRTEFLTIKEVCELLSVKESWVRSQIMQKKIPYTKVGWLIRFKKEDLELWLKSK
jgi:excisionase family DNA binding protein